MIGVGCRNGQSSIFVEGFLGSIWAMMHHRKWKHMAYYILYHFITFHYVLYHFITFYIILLHFITFYYTLLHFITFHYILYHFITFYYMLLQSNSCTQISLENPIIVECVVTIPIGSTLSRCSTGQIPIFLGDSPVCVGCKTAVMVMVNSTTPGKNLIFAA